LADRLGSCTFEYERTPDSREAHERTTRFGLLAGRQPIRRELSLRSGRRERLPVGRASAAARQKPGPSPAHSLSLGGAETIGHSLRQTALSRAIAHRTPLRPTHELRWRPRSATLLGATIQSSKALGSQQTVN